MAIRLKASIGNNCRIYVDINKDMGWKFMF